jgi:hypothetical protein
MVLILNRFDQLLQQYEQALQQQQSPGLSKTLKNVERQLAYLVKVTITLFSFGMPSATSKAAMSFGRPKKKADSADPMTLINQMMYGNPYIEEVIAVGTLPAKEEKYLDLQIV